MPMVSWERGRAFVGSKKGMLSLCRTEVVPNVCLPGCLFVGNELPPSFCLLDHWRFLIYRQQVIFPPKNRQYIPTVLYVVGVNELTSKECASESYS